LCWIEDGGVRAKCFYWMFWLIRRVFIGWNGDGKYQMKQCWVDLWYEGSNDAQVLEEAGLNLQQ
jgi:hypothetical protein